MTREIYLGTKDRPWPAKRHWERHLTEANRTSARVKPLRLGAVHDPAQHLLFGIRSLLTGRWRIWPPSGADAQHCAWQRARVMRRLDWGSLEDMGLRNCSVPAGETPAAGRSGVTLCWRTTGLVWCGDLAHSRWITPEGPFFCSFNVLPACLANLTRTAHHMPSRLKPSSRSGGDQRVLAAGALRGP